MASQRVTTAEAPGTFCPEHRRRYVLMTAILASALGFIDSSVVSIAIPVMRADLGASLADVQWISNAYMLLLSALILVGGATGDRVGLRKSFAAGIAVFVGASAACALAPTVDFLIAARAVQGLGAAFMVPASLAIIAKAYPARTRGRAIGLWASASAMTTALGPIVGGLFLSSGVEHAWRLIFAVNLPLGGLALFFLVFRIPPDQPTERKPIDVPGALLATTFLGGLALSLTSLQGVGSGSDPGGLVWASGAIGLLAFLLFLFWERRSAHPMLRLSLFFRRSFSAANVVTFLLYFALSANLFFLPMTLIAGWRLGEVQASLLFLPLSGSIALLSGVSGRLADRIGARLPILAGCIVVGLAFTALGAGIGLRSFWFHILPSMLAVGLGMALVVSPLSAAVMGAVDDGDTGAASGINNAVARIAGLVAVAALGTFAGFIYRTVLLRSPDVASRLSGVGFGEPAGGIDRIADGLRIAATDAAFAGIAYLSAALCMLAALTAYWGLPAKDRQPSRA